MHPKLKSKLKSIKPLDLLLLLLLIANTINIVWFISKNEILLTSEACRIVYKSYDIFKEATSPNTNVTQIYEHFTRREILLLLAPLPMLYFFGFSQAPFVLLNVIFSNILLVGIYKLGEEVKDKKAGLLASIFLFVTPSFIGYTHTYSEEFVMLPFLVLSLYFILKSNFFQNRVYTILAFSLFTIGSLFKSTLFLYLIGPSIGYAFFKREKINKKRIWNFIEGLLIPIIIFLLLYPTLKSLAKLYWFKATIFEHDYSLLNNKNLDKYGFLFSTNNIFFHIFASANQLQIICTAVFLATIPLFIKKINYKKITLILGIAIPYIFFTFFIVKNKEPTFIYPIVPFIALISGIGISEIKNKRLMAIGVLIFTNLCVAQYYLITNELVVRTPLTGYVIFRGDGPKVFESERNLATIFQRSYGEFLLRMKEETGSLKGIKIRILQCTSIENDFFHLVNRLYEEGVRGVEIIHGYPSFIKTQFNYTVYDYIVYDEWACPREILERKDLEILHREIVSNKSIFLLTPK